MKYKAMINNIWVDDNGVPVRVVANVTVISTSRTLDENSPPYFYKVREPRKAEADASRKKTKKQFIIE